MIGKNGNFLKDHYDWLAAAAAFALLVVGGIMYAGSMDVDGESLAAKKKSEVDAVRPGGKHQAAADLSDFTAVTKAAKSPSTVPEVTEKSGSFLASEHREFCEGCRAPVAMKDGVCPLCKFERKQELVIVVDSDNDGMLDEWEKKYGLNVNDPGDAELDADGDGFTNLEEFTAKTDPTDKTSHPDYLDSLKLVLPLKQAVLPFVFTGTYKTPSGQKFQFKDPSREREYDRGVYSLLAGEQIGNTGYFVKDLVQRSEKVAIGGGMTKTVEVFVAVVVRKSDGKEVQMLKDRKNVPVDAQAKLVYERGGGKEFTVVTGDTIDLNGTKYEVKSIEPKGKGAAVTLEQPPLGKIRVLQALES